MNYIIWIGLLTFFIIIIANHFNKEREGVSAEVYGTESGYSEVYSVVCRESSKAAITETPTDDLIAKTANDYLATMGPLLKDYINQLQNISEKFNNISSALSIGNIDVSSPQTDPIVVITTPLNDKIEQTLNFIMPKGAKGKDGLKPTMNVNGPIGIQGEMGKQGKEGTYIVIQQQKLFPNKVKNLQ